MLFGSSNADALVGSSTRAPQYWFPGSLDAGNYTDGLFGTETIAGDFNCDGVDDLAITTQRTSPPSNVTVLYDKRDYGLVRNNARLFTLEQFAGSNSGASSFGRTLAAGQFHYNNCTSLIVGIPDMEISNQRSAGAVLAIFWTQPKQSRAAWLPALAPGQRRQHWRHWWRCRGL